MDAAFSSVVWLLIVIVAGDESALVTVSYFSMHFDSMMRGLERGAASVPPLSNRLTISRTVSSASSSTAPSYIISPPPQPFSSRM
uniref:Putative secreted protein n=1 Tax=Anopheles darlingi TaxID=43151 RepID=A0A2M4DHU0_ANODA